MVIYDSTYQLDIRLDDFIIICQTTSSLTTEEYNSTTTSSKLQCMDTFLDMIKVALLLEMYLQLGWSQSRSKDGRTQAEKLHLS